MHLLTHFVCPVVAGNIPREVITGDPHAESGGVSGVFGRHSEAFLLRF